MNGTARPTEGIVLPKDTENFITKLKEKGARVLADGGSHFTLMGALGKGKFATVYKAQQQDEEMVAVKKVQIFEMSAKSRDKCLREVMLLESMNHPNIIKYKDSYIDPETNELIIILEWARGGDMKKLIKKVKKAGRGFSERQVWRYCRELSSGLAHMHEKRVMHRDLKPANIMLTRDNKIKLGDLGLSRFFTEQTLEAFSKVGTPLYMSPEVLLGEGYEFPADIWSLGCVLYELCMLRSPFKPEKGVNLYELFKRIKSGKYPEIPEQSIYSSNLRGLIDSMLVLQPGNRPTIDYIYIAAAAFAEGKTPDFSQLELKHQPSESDPCESETLSNKLGSPQDLQGTNQNGSPVIPPTHPLHPALSGGTTNTEQNAVMKENGFTTNQQGFPQIGLNGNGGNHLERPGSRKPNREHRKSSLTDHQPNGGVNQVHDLASKFGFAPLNPFDLSQTEQTEQTEQTKVLADDPSSHQHTDQREREFKRIRQQQRDRERELQAERERKQQQNRRKESHEQENQAWNIRAERKRSRTMIKSVNLRGTVGVAHFFDRDCHVAPDVLMELLLTKMIALNYEQHFVKTLHFSPLSPTHFCFPRIHRRQSGNTGQQFLEFASLVAWLLKLNCAPLDPRAAETGEIAASRDSSPEAVRRGAEHLASLEDSLSMLFQYHKDNTKPVTGEELTLNMRQEICGFISRALAEFQVHIVPGRLQNGWGLESVLALSCLANGALHRQRYRIPKPRYPNPDDLQEVVEVKQDNVLGYDIVDETDDLTLNSLVEGGLWCTAKSAATVAEMLLEKELSKLSTTIPASLRSNEEKARAINEWRLEFDRLCNRGELRFKPTNTGDAEWRTHFEQMQDHYQTLYQSMPQGYRKDEEAKSARRNSVTSATPRGSLMDPISVLNKYRSKLSEITARISTHERTLNMAFSGLTQEYSQQVKIANEKEKEYTELGQSVHSLVNELDRLTQAKKAADDERKEWMNTFHGNGGLIKNIRQAKMALQSEVTQLQLRLGLMRSQLTRKLNSSAFK